MKFIELFAEKIYHDKKGYAIIWKNGKDQKLHKLVWEYHYGKKPDGMEIHHKDWDKSNYSIDNLELVTVSDHQKIHNGWIIVDGEWFAKVCFGCGQTLTLDNFYERKTAGTPTALCKTCHNKATRRSKCVL